MSLMHVFQVMGGLAIFIFGMKLMSSGLHQVAGERMRSILSPDSGQLHTGAEPAERNGSGAGGAGSGRRGNKNALLPGV